MCTGDEIVVLQFDHLLPMPELIGLLVRLVARGIVVESIADRFSTRDTTVAGLINTFGSYMAIEPHRPRHRGRTPSLSTEDARRARKMIVEDNVPVTEVASIFGVSRATIYRRVPLSRLEQVT